MGATYSSNNTGINNGYTCDCNKIKLQEEIIKDNRRMIELKHAQLIKLQEELEVHDELNNICLEQLQDLNAGKSHFGYNHWTNYHTK